MRILILANSEAVHAQRWCRALVTRGHRVFLLDYGTKGIEGVERIPYGVPAYVPPWSLRFPQGWFGRCHAFVRSVVKQTRCDLFHIHFLHDYRLRKADLLGRPLVISVWGKDVIPFDTAEGEEEHETRLRKLDLLRDATRVTATTHFLEGKCRDYAAGIDLGAIPIVPFGVETAALRTARDRRTQRPPPFRIGFMKSLEPKYGPEIALRALQIVISGEPDVELHMYGQGTLGEPMKRLANELGLANRVVWHGRIPYGEVPAAHAAMDVAIMPSLHGSESFGVAAVEAQAAGVPVVASDWPGVREAVVDGVGGFLVPPGDAEALAGAVLRLLKDDELRRTMGEHGAEFVRTHFEWSKCVDAMVSLYEELCGRST